MPGPASISSISSKQTWDSATTVKTDSSDTDSQPHGFLDTIRETVRGRSRSPRPQDLDIELEKYSRKRSAEPARHQSIRSEKSSPRQTAEPKPRLKRYNSGSVKSYTQYGRHSNEWLFGNISITDTVKSLLDGGRKNS
ncbi:hypothetical protein K431DRAFT_19623 [Polychaeton citri CBS 116435]|uniref:Uncharacterized protein n=1 Tax=Polychaeton citri CBS 116435 TaxID=1314669 RepID=A0A9P4Q1M5_9PEZI|nr:hypothetical protein K431DRAFT_19623 [Polychaeton citri CBS 116435]